MQLPVNLFKSKTGVKAAAILLIVTLLIITFTSMTMGAPGVTYGDVNNDGDIDVRDVVLVMQYIIGLRNLTDDQLKAADVNGDGTVDVQDATLIMQHVLGIKELAVPVESVEKVEISVPYGTPVDSIEFPDTVTAVLQDESEEEIDVEWETTSDPTYNPQSHNEYTFKGDLVDLPAGITNPDEIQAVAVVTVEKIDVPAYRGPTDPKPTTYSLYLYADPENAGTLAGEGNYESGAVVPIAATPNPGYEFNFWSAPDGVGSFGDVNSQNTTYTMPSQNVDVAANFVVGGITVVSASDLKFSSPADAVYFSPAEYVYSTDWEFSIDDVGLLEDQIITIDLSDETNSALVYSTSTVHYIIDDFSVDASDAQHDSNPQIVLRAESDVGAGTNVTITVYIGVKEAVEPEDFAVTFTRNDTGASDNGVFGIESPQ